LTRKVTEAMRHPAVRALSHPKGRIINHRPPNALDLERTFEVALETGVAIETNGLPDRLDLSRPQIPLALQGGGALRRAPRGPPPRVARAREQAPRRPHRTPRLGDRRERGQHPPARRDPQRGQKSEPRHGRTVPPYNLTAPRTSSSRRRRHTHIPCGGGGQSSGWSTSSVGFIVAQRCVSWPRPSTWPSSCATNNVIV